VADSSSQYPWYDTVEGESIEQGDFLPNFEVVVPQIGAAVHANEFQVDVRVFDFVVLTQTCDIENGKVDSLLLCPWWDLWQFVDAAKAKGENWGAEIREALRRGNLPGYHLLNGASQADLEIGVGLVDFHEVYTAPVWQVVQFARHAGKRLRLRPPYREHLAQAFARFFMRVGLPADIPKESVRKKPR
jgi:hypothetical protein